MRYGKAIVQLVGSDIMRGRLEVACEGSQNNLYSHCGTDGFWMVLAGRVRFYGPGDVLIGEFGKYEGTPIPRGEQYWFEGASDDEELEILQMGDLEQGAKVERVDAEPQKLSVELVYVREVTQTR
tara:strand:+ start:117 stop:491 length:375 start_codon:yes stop_codon:yes gene_type:complete